MLGVTDNNRFRYCTKFYFIEISFFSVILTRRQCLLNLKKQNDIAYVCSGTYRILTKFGINVVFKEIFDPHFFFIGNRRCRRGESFNCGTHFVKYLGNYEMKLAFFNDEFNFNGAYHFTKIPFI